MEKFRKIVNFIFVILFSLFLIGCSQSPEDIVESFEEAILEKDSKGLLELVTLADDVHWSEQQAEQIIHYFSENPEKFSQQLTMLREQAIALEENQPFSSDEGLFYFFDEETLHVRSYDLFLSRDSMSEQGFEQATISLSEKEIVFDEVTDEMFIKSVGPGTYDLDIAIDYEYAKESHDQTVELYDHRSFEHTVSIEAKGRFVHLLNAYPETVLTIDDEQVDEEIFNENAKSGIHGDYKLHPVKFGPVDEGKKLHSSLKLPWNGITLESDTFIFEDDGGHYTDQSVGNEFDLTPKILSDEDVQGELLDLVVDYYEKLFEALRENDKNIMDDAPASKKVVRNLDGHFSKIGGSLNSFYAGELEEVSMNFGDITLNDDGLPIIKTYLYTNFKFFVTKHSLKHDGDKMNYLNRRLTFDQVDDEWVIVDEEGDFYGRSDLNLDDDHIQTIEVK